jgi:hypothetical protein
MTRRDAIVAAHAVVLLGAILLLSGCAAIFRGPRQLVPIDSVPAGAEVFVNGELVGRTPLQVELGRASEHLITLRWNGQERSVTLYPQLDGEGGALLAVEALPGGVVIGLGVRDLAACPPRGQGGWFDGLCQDIHHAQIGIGAALLLLPVAIDAGTGGIFQLSPSEIFVAFE